MNKRTFAGECNRLDREFNKGLEDRWGGMGSRVDTKAATWADEHYVDYTATYYRGVFTCLDCGHTFSSKDTKIKIDYYTKYSTKYTHYYVVCPECGKLCKVEFSKAKKGFDKYVQFGIKEWYGNIEVLRIYEGHYYPGSKENDWWEVCREYRDLTDDSNVRYSTRAFNMCSYRCQSPWRRWSKLIHRSLSNYYSSHDTAARNYCDLRDEYIYPNIPSLPEFTDSDMRIFKGKETAVFHAINGHKIRKGINDLTSAIFDKDIYESIAKMGYGNMVLPIKESHNYSFCDRHGELSFKNHIMPALKICARNGYKIEDPQMYLDYLGELTYLERDVHNAFYVCPDDLIEAHNKTCRQKERVKEFREKELERKRALKQEDRYHEEKKFFLGIAFQEDTEHLNFHVIQSVEEMQDEGKHMHHCVGMYWSHDDSLIIGCRDADNKRVATIEVNLKDFSIVQTRGVSNSVPEHFELINSTIMANMGKIKDAQKLRAAQTAKREKEQMKKLLRAG